ncbi:MAG: sulfotransferase [Pseudomonadota bacterium]
MGEQHFHPEALIEQAMESTELNDFGDLPVHPGLEALCETYDRHVRDPEGRAKCRDRLVNLLSVRLRLERAFKTIPDVAEQEITAPLFVTGLPRSGTSALINLLAGAPENRGLLQWEVQFPDPWPGLQPGQEDPRYSYLVKALEDHQDEDFKKIHFVTADTPEECCMIHAYALHGVQLGFEIMLEPYRSWLLAQDLEPLYRYQKKQLQLLNWRNPGQRWVLKAPAHMWAVDTIQKVFSDANFVWCHREPVAVTASINSMNREVMRMYAGDSSHISATEIGRAVMEWYALSLERGLAARDASPSERFVDCSQEQIAQSPLAVIDSIYGAFNWPLSDESRSAFQHYVDANPKGKHGKHEYDLASYGLTAGEVKERFAFYTDNSDWPISA